MKSPVEEPGAQNDRAEKRAQPPGMTGDEAFYRLALLEVIQPFPTFSEAVFPALRVLDAKVNPPMPAAVTASTG